ncbi:hypothetical protein FQN50_002393 [Emmonsiellopsis sp. PD_5]|nr:hypothetical protein FQN50_002393 [Emmonsiellopsis sp. PD_5]
MGEGAKDLVLSIWHPGPGKRPLNTERLQQYSPRMEQFYREALQEYHRTGYMVLDDWKSLDVFIFVAGVRWSEDGVNWAVIHSMDPHITDEWMGENVPPGHKFPGECIAALRKHLEMEGKLPPDWRKPFPNMGMAWTIEEDIEILEYILHDRKRIDAKVFVPSNRSGVDVATRAKFLEEDAKFISTVRKAEKEVAEALLRYDSSRPSRKGNARVALEATEAKAEQTIRRALAQSVWGSSKDKPSLVLSI